MFPRGFVTCAIRRTARPRGTKRDALALNAFCLPDTTEGRSCSLDNLMVEKKAVPPEQLMKQVMNVVAQGLVVLK